MFVSDSISVSFIQFILIFRFDHDNGTKAAMDSQQWIEFW